MKTQYTFFWNGPFSNWHHSVFVYKNNTFNNSEQAYMWEKALFFGDTETADKILKCKSPKEAKDLGRAVKNYDDFAWSNVRFDIMYNVCFEKYNQNPRLKNLILENSNFVEASPYDKIWGIGMREGAPGIEDSNNWKGQNLLGKVLNKVKENIS